MPSPYGLPDSPQVLEGKYTRWNAFFTAPNIWGDNVRDPRYQHNPEVAMKMSVPSGWPSVPTLKRSAHELAAIAKRKREDAEFDKAYMHYSTRGLDRLLGLPVKPLPTRAEVSASIAISRTSSSSSSGSTSESAVGAESQLVTPKDSPPTETTPTFSTHGGKKVRLEKTQEGLVRIIRVDADEA